MFDIDYVFPWVNDQDPVWQKTYIDFCKKHGYKDRLEKVHNCRYRDWGLLKYLFRAIARNMPWIRKVHLIVSNKEQVPEWLNTDTVHIVLHEDIMPPEVLPTYNSNVIEMFLVNIQDLSEYFIYGNDDMIPLNLSYSTEWFDQNGNPCFNMNSSKIASNMYRTMISNEWWLLQERLNLTINKQDYWYPLHGLVPLRLSYCKEVLNLLNDQIIPSCSYFREAKNLTPYIYTDYTYLTNRSQKSNITFEYLNLNNFNLLYKKLIKTQAQIICINDSGIVSNQAYRIYRQYLNTFFNRRFPEKCKYER